MAIPACLFISSVNLGIYAILDHSYFVRGHPEEKVRILGRALRYRDYAVKTPGNEGLHADEGIKLSDPLSLPEPGGLLQVSLPVYGERMMNSSYYWYVQPFY